MSFPMLDVLYFKLVLYEICTHSPEGLFTVIINIISSSTITIKHIACPLGNNFPSSLSPVCSQDTMHLPFSHLTSNYIDRVIVAA